MPLFLRQHATRMEMSTGRLSPLSRLAAGATILFALSGCMSSDLDTGPQPGVNATGTYPSLGKPVQSATAQMSDAEATSMGRHLEKLAKDRKGGAISEAEYQRKLAELTKLAKSTEKPQSPE